MSSTRRLPSRLAFLAPLAALLAPLHPSLAQRLTGTVGLGVATLPKYSGGDDYRVLPLPVLQLEYRRRVHLGGSSSGVGAGLGVYLVRTTSLTVDVGLAGSETRPERRGDALAGMGTRRSASFGSTTVEYRLGVLSIASSVGIGLGEKEGNYGALNVTVEQRLAERVFVSVASSVTVADARHMAFEFGVSDEQSARRRALAAAGDPRLRGVDTRAYAPEAGLKQVSGGTTLMYLLTEHTRALAFAQVVGLSRAASDSPIVQSRTGVATGLALAYAF